MVIKEGTNGWDDLWAYGNDTLLGYGDNDYLHSGTASTNDSLCGGEGDDIYFVFNLSAEVFENPGEGGFDKIQLDLSATAISDINYTLPDNIEALTLNGNVNQHMIITGSSEDNVINCTNNADYIDGEGGNDNISGYDGDDTLIGGAGNDYLLGGMGNDTYYLENSGDNAYDEANGGNDTIYAGFATGLSSYIENLVLLGSDNLDGFGNNLDNLIIGNSGDNNLQFVAGNDTIYGMAGNDYLSGNIGDDILDGGTGADQMEGGIGNDTYYVDNAGDDVLDWENDGIDIVYSSSDTWNLWANSEIEKIILTGTEDISITGNGYNNTIIGNSGNNVLRGEGGSDTLVGDGGNDTFYGGANDDVYYVDEDDFIIENSDEGLDIVYASSSFTLDDNIENFILTGTGNSNGIGNDLDNTLIGNQGNNVLNGVSGNDTYVLNFGGGQDTIQDDAGTDTINFGAGIAGNNLFFVLDENDLVIGFNSSSDEIIVQNWNSNLCQIELLEFSDESTLAADEIQTKLDNLREGTDGNDTITGNNTDNVMDGKWGNDKLYGGNGNDVYYVDNAGDKIIEYSNQGVDTVISSITYKIGSYLENLKLAGSDNINGTGNSYNNFITGNSGYNVLNGDKGNDKLLGNNGDDTLNGGLGNDTLIGEFGNDTYYIDAYDTIIENPDGGNDKIISATNCTLAADVEKLTLTGTSNIWGIGNELANYITGNKCSNVLDGKNGNDILVGGYGSDIYYVDSSDDVIIEYSRHGIDTVNSNISYCLGSYSEKWLENLTLIGLDNINGTGNEINNTIKGNNGNNILNGNKGNDKLYGGIGNDIYYIENYLDIIYESTDSGVDTVISPGSYTLRSNVENLTLTGTANKGVGNGLDNFLTGSNIGSLLVGNAGNDTLLGGIGYDTLNGGTDSDSMTGGGGNDIYYVDNLCDNVVEDYDSGTDKVYCTIDSYELAENVENLVLLGIYNSSGTGNYLDNTIIGNRYNNTLDGRGGNDTLIGGFGNDIYYVYSDYETTIVENTDQGTDTVFSFISYTLGSNLENLTLLEVSGGNTTAAGNNLKNTITGNTGNNTIYGFAGNDFIVGEGSNDILSGGSGNDTYFFNTIGGISSINDESGKDVIKFGSNINQQDIAIFMQDSDLIIDYDYASENSQIIVSNQTNKLNAIEKIKLNDGKFLTTIDIQHIINDISAYIPSETGIPYSNIAEVKSDPELMSIIFAHWHE